MARAQDIARELYYASRRALEDGNLRAAALLACTALISLGINVERMAGLRDAVSMGFKPEASDVEALLDELRQHININDEEIVIELSIKRILLIISGLGLAILVFLEILPPWIDAILIPGAIASLTLAILWR